jgi:hypothetical protein
MQSGAIPHERERIAAQPAGDRFDDGDGRRRRDGRIDRIAALP